MRSAFVSPRTFDGFIPGARTGKEGIRPGIDHGLDDDGLALPTLVDAGTTGQATVAHQADGEAVAYLEDHGFRVHRIRISTVDIL